MPASPQIATWFILFAGLGQVDGASHHIPRQGYPISCDSYALSLRPARPGLFVDSLTQGRTLTAGLGWAG
ncbi:hypothetical protein QWA68_001545 [Fusarium oxysporum]|nr:hypothetical protein QWA68_001545 [Fusarium oxysporum]